MQSVPRLPLYRAEQSASARALHVLRLRLSLPAPSSASIPIEQVSRASMPPLQPQAGSEAAVGVAFAFADGIDAVKQSGAQGIIITPTHHPPHTHLRRALHPIFATSSPFFSINSNVSAQQITTTRARKEGGSTEAARSRAGAHHWHLPTCLSLSGRKVSR